MNHEITLAFRKYDYSRKKVEDNTEFTQHYIDKHLRACTELKAEIKAHHAAKKAEQTAEIIKLLKQGKSVRYITRTLHVDTSRVYSIRRDQRLAPEPKKEKKAKYYVNVFPY